MKSKGVLSLIAGSLVAILPLSPAFAQSLSFSDSNVLGEQSLAPSGTVTTDIPLLTRFELGFESGDRHIQDIQVAAPGGAFLGVVNFKDKRATSSDRYGYSLDWDVLPSASIPTGTRTESGLCNGGSCSVSIGHHPGSNGTFALVSFSFFFQYTDHHIDAIGVREHNGDLTVEYNDKNNDDAFAWLVEFVHIPNSLVRSTTTVNRSNAQGIDSASTGMTGDTVIGGFRLDFASSDHHIQDIAVDTRFSSFVTVRYNDKNSDDFYSWSVDIVELD